MSKESSTWRSERLGNKEVKVVRWGESGTPVLVFPTAAGDCEECERFKLIQGREALSTYSFNTQVARHYFCSTCGIKSFYVPRSHPDGISVNARCIDSGTVTSMTITAFNGKEWEKGRADYRETT